LSFKEPTQPLRDILECVLMIGDFLRAVAPHRDLGSLIRHAYDKVDLEFIWHKTTDDLPPSQRPLF
jgi:hypothetical protein